MTSGEPRQGPGCSIPNLLVPLFLVAGGVAGWVLASPHGIVLGVLGAAAWVAAGIPVLGLTLTVVVGPLLLWERLTRKSRPE